MKRINFRLVVTVQEELGQFFVVATVLDHPLPSGVQKQATATAQTAERAAIEVARQLVRAVH